MRPQSSKMEFKNRLRNETMKSAAEEALRYIRLVGQERRKGQTLSEVSRTWQGEKECFAFFSPHDDDVVLGAGLLMQTIQQEGVPVHVVIVTDGSMGYCSPEEKDAISEIRKKETYDCYIALGIPQANIHWLGFPDCSLTHYRGRRLAQPADAGQVAGYTGLQNAFTRVLRNIRPTQCFVPTFNDLHPDHKITYDELLISLFHAGGSIWPELGCPLDKTPHVHEMGIYCDFPEPPTLRVQTDEDILENKLRAIGAFQSQKQIAALIEGVRRSGPYEYFRSLNFQLYKPQRYFDLFEKKHHIPFVR